MDETIVIEDNPNNISKYNKISKEILTIGTLEKPLLSIKHMITINKRRLTTNERIPHFFEYMTKAEYIPYDKVMNIGFTKTFDCIQIESRIHKNINSQFNDFIKCKILYKDFVETKKALKEVEKWFDEIKDLYTIHEYTNKIIDVKSSYKELIQVVFFKGYGNRFISFQPSIVYDNTLTYPGVEIKCDQGIIANVSLDEFLTIEMALTEYMNNFNLFSINMLQLLYLHCIGNPEFKNTINL